MVDLTQGPAVQYPKLVIFGDSIVQYSVRAGGFLSLFSERYERKLDVVVRGFSGYNSDHYPVIAPSVLRGLGPGPIAAIVLFIGTNDATIPESFQHVPLSRTIKNLHRTLEILVPAAEKVIVVPPAYCIDSLRDDRIDKDFAEYSLRICQERAAFLERRTAGIPRAPHNLCFINSRQVLGRRARVEGQPPYDRDTLLDDGLHWTPLGYSKMFEAIDQELTDLSQKWNFKLAPLEAFMHISVADQLALLRGHVAIEAGEKE